MHAQEAKRFPGPIGPRTGSPGDGRPVAGSPPPVVDTARLFGDRDELTLLHRGAEYRLRITRFGRLILTK